MKLRQHLILAFLLAALQAFSMGQDQSPQTPVLPASPDSTSQTSQGQASQDQPSQDQAQPGQTSTGNATSTRTAPAAPLSGIAVRQTDVGTEDTSNVLPQLPELLGGKGVATVILTGLERSNFLRAGLNVGAAYNDNPLLLSGGAVGDASVSVFPNISIEQSSSRMRWMLGYAGGLTVNQRFTSQDEGSHDVNFDSDFRLSPHVSLRVAENFAITTGFFDAGNNSDLIAGAGAGAGAPNSTLIAPLATDRTSLTTVESSYHFALNDLVGASGSFYDLHFTNLSEGSALTELADSQTATGSAFWLHRIFGGDWGGASYRFDRLTFSGGGETRVHSFFAVDTAKLSSHLTLTGFAGPQYDENQWLVLSGGTNQLMETNNWSFAGGVDGGWQNLRTGLFAGYSRSISDGGGILGAVVLQNVHASFRRELVPGWTATASAGHGTNQALLASEGSIDSTSAGITLERNVGKSVGFRAGYAHIFQQQYFPPAASYPSFDASQNRFFVTLSYQWAKPLGM